MPTIITHSVFAISLAHVFKHNELPIRFWLLAAVCSMLPDIAFLTSLVVVLGAFYQEKYSSLRPRLILFFFLVTASHGLFDALTNGGLGIAFFSPFDNSRYFLPIRPIQVSPIGLHDFLKWGGWKVLTNEFKWIALPSILLLLLSILVGYLMAARQNKVGTFE